MANVEVAQYDVVEIILGDVGTADQPSLVDVIFCDPVGCERRVPAYVAGGQYHVRCSSETIGSHRYDSVSSGKKDSLDNPNGTVHVVRAKPDAHGPLRVAENNLYFEYADGTPFLWLADTWWHGFVERISDIEFGYLAKKRTEQGFSVVQIVAGLYPEMQPFSPEGRSVSGWVWSENFTEPNPAWFDEAERRIFELLKHNLTPCIVGCWSHYLEHMSTAQMLRHWRELIARWGAYPVVWCLVGEPPIPTSEQVELRKHLDNIAPWLPPHFTARDRDEATTKMLNRLQDVACGVRELEPFGRPIGIHSNGALPWLSLHDEEVVDFWLHQTGHTGTDAVERAVGNTQETIAHAPYKPVINGEPPYEGICGSYWEDCQRFLFWSHMLSGAAGHTYGAHGVWGFNTPEFPGFLSGRAPIWKEAINFRGASQVGIGRKILMKFPWHKFEPHPEWLGTPETLEPARNHLGPFVAGNHSCRLIYLPPRSLVHNRCIYFCNLGQKRWQAQLINPRTAQTEIEIFVEPDSEGTAIFPLLSSDDRPLVPSWEDWLIVLTEES